MKLGAPIEVAPGVHQLRAIAARVTVLSHQGEVALVDAGAKGSLGPISSGLAALGLSLDQVSLVVLTHYHPDHSGGLDKLVEATAAKVAVHALESDIISGADPAPSPHRNVLLAGVTRPFVKTLYGRPVDVAYRLEDDDRLPVAEDVSVVHTPGHTAGSICLHLASKGVLIVGDVLQYRFRRLAPPAALVTRDPAQAIESLKKLLLLEFDTICFSHYPPLRRNARAALERLIESAA